MATAKLAKYQQMRDFGQTAEPSGDNARLVPSEALRFVIQKLAASVEARLPDSDAYGGPLDGLKPLQVFVQGSIALNRLGTLSMATGHSRSLWRKSGELGRQGADVRGGAGMVAHGLDMGSIALAG